MKAILADTKSSITHGIKLSSTMTVLVIGLKLTDNIKLDWLWVFSPLWVPATMIVVLFLVIFICMSIYKIWQSCFKITLKE